jgi:hypothetical protein
MLGAAAWQAKGTHEVEELMWLTNRRRTNRN